MSRIEADFEPSPIEDSSDDGLGPVKRKSLVDDAYDQIRSSVVRGNLKPGTRLIETSLATEMAVSRGTVRSALRRLVAEGLVAEEPHKGCVVRELSLEELVDLFNARVGIERAAIRLCARRRVSTERLWKQVRAMESAAAAGDTAQLAADEFRFHETLCELSENPYLLRNYRSLAAQIRIAIGQDTDFTASPATAPEAHVPLVNAIDDGDEWLAEALLEHHINFTVAEYLKKRGLQDLLERVLTPSNDFDLNAVPFQIAGGMGDPSGVSSQPMQDSRG